MSAAVVRSTRGVVVRAVVAAVVSGVVLYVVGLDVGHVLALAAGVAAVTAAVQVLPPVPVVGWPAPPEPDDSTGWHQVRLLAQTLEQLDGEPDRVERTLLPRLRALAGARLAARGLDPASPAARELLGADLHDRLGGATPSGPARRPVPLRRGRPATDLVRAVLDRLDELDAVPSPETPIPPSTTQGDRP